MYMMQWLTSHENAQINPGIWLEDEITSIKQNKSPETRMISKINTGCSRSGGSRRLMGAFNPLVAILMMSVILAQTNYSHSLREQPTEQMHQKQVNNICPKNWIHLAQKCYKILHSPRNYASATVRCRDLFAELTIIEDESSKEKESSATSNTNIMAYLSSEQRKSEQQRQYYVNLSLDLMNQFRERQNNGYYADASSTDSYDHVDTDMSASDLWLPRDDPSIANITNNAYDKDGPNAFVLAFSHHYMRWGIVPISPTRKMPFICERPVDSGNSNAQQSPSLNVASDQTRTVDQKRTITAVSQSSTGSVTGQNPLIASSLDSRRALERESTTTVQPEASSVLFREFPQDQSIVLGSTAEMRCSPLESESTLSWTFNGGNLTQSNRVRSYSNGTLRIEHVRFADYGNYTCTIHSGGASESKSARLEIIEKPHQPEYITAELLDKLSTSVRIKWTPGFNGNSPITKYLVEMRTVNNDNIEGEISSIMQSNSWEVAKANISADQTSVIIPDLKPAKKYIFRIKATNKIGTGDPSLPTKHPIEVPVQPPSMPPENPSGSPKSSTSIAIHWLPPPVDSHNGLLKGYKIRHKLAGYASDSDWYTNDVTDAARLTYVLDDLIAWQNYEIQIAAENDKGVGPFCSSIFVRTKEGKPDKGPRSVTAEAVSSTVVKINWNPPPPQRINGINQGYKVEAWYDLNHSQLAKEMIVPHNTESPFHSANLDGLLPYTEYFISVKCFTSAGDGPPNEDIVMVKTKQDLPEAVTALEFADVLDKSLRILWKAPKRTNGELDHYTLEYSETSASDKKIIKNFPAVATEARITDLIPQTSYTFKIYAYTSIGPGPSKVNQTTTTVPPVLPEPPSNLVYSDVGPHSVTIQFSPGFDGNAAIEKWIAEALTPVRGDYSPRWTVVYVSTNHTVPNKVVVRNLQPFTRYKIRLTPANIVGQSRYPSEPSLEFQTAQVEPEHPPKDLTIEDIKSNSVVARWLPLTNNLWLGNPRGYNLTWVESGNSTIMYHLISDPRVDFYLIKDLEEFTDYSFRIQAVNEAGSSPPSEPILVTTLEDVPSSGPTNLTAHPISSSAISIDWNPVPRKHRNGIIRGYKIQYQSLNPDAPLQHKAVEDNSTRRITLTDLKAFTTYKLAVAAFTNAGDGVYSTVLNVQTLEDTPGMPQNLSFPVVSQTAARILWDPPEEPNGDILGYKVSYHALTEGSKEVASHELHQNERTFKASNLKPDTHYVFTVTAKTKEGWGQQASVLLYTYDSELRANLPFFRESWFVILCASLSFVITIIITALLIIQTKSSKYKRDAIKSVSQDRLGDAGFSIDDEPGNHYNNGFGLLSNVANHKRSNGAISQSTANFTIPKTPPRPHLGSVVYSDEGDDDVFESIIDKPVKNDAGTSKYDSSGDSLTEKPSEISSSTGPESESADDEYVNMAKKHYVNHYANVNGTLRSQKIWNKSGKHYSSHRTKPKLPQRPAPSVPQVPSEPTSSGSDNVGQPLPSTSGVQTIRSTNSIYGESQIPMKNRQMHPDLRTTQASSSSHSNGRSDTTELEHSDQNPSQDLLNSHIVNLNGGRIIVDNMAGSRAPLPGFTSFV